VDLRGHGVSDKPVQDYTVAGFADDLAWLCAQLGLAKPVVVGHSMGGNVAFELGRQHPDLPSAVVALDSAIVRPDWLVPEARQHADALRGRDYQEVQRRYAEAFFLPTDEAYIKARLIEGLSSLPQHVTLSAWEQHLLVWDGEKRPLPVECRPCSSAPGHHCPTSHASRADSAAGDRPNRGRRSLHYAFVPVQVNAMIERFLSVALPAAA
jgi:pimeloyl-ACP methyl ester carboxylesterase